jgi:hypothetical protein
MTPPKLEAGFVRMPEDEFEGEPEQKKVRGTFFPANAGPRR